MLGMLIGPIAEIAKSWVGGKVAVSKAKAEARLEATRAETEVMKKVTAGELDWNQTMAKASNTSWKDEWLTVLSIDTTYPSIHWL